MLGLEACTVALVVEDYLEGLEWEAEMPRAQDSLRRRPHTCLWALNNKPRVSCSGCYGNSFPPPLSREAKGPAGRP